MSDMDQIVNLWHELMAFHIKLDSFFELRDDAEQNFRTFLKSNITEEKGAIVFVAIDNDEILGYIIGFIAENPPVFIVDKYGLICDACVSKNRRRQGIGERLYKSIKNWFYKQGITQIQLETSVRNPLSIPFWKKMGFISLFEKMYLNKKISD